MGASITIDGIPLTVVGVAPPGFDYPGKAVLWKPAAFSSGNNGWGTVARLKPDISWPQARAAFAVEVERLSPKQEGVGNSNLRPSITSLQDGVAGPVKDASLMFMGAVVLVLLIACTNVANLSIARTNDRAAELSIRSALGASRARLARQLFAECLLLSLIATLAGFAIAFWITSFAAKIRLRARSSSFPSLDILPVPIGRPAASRHTSVEGTGAGCARAQLPASGTSKTQDGGSGLRRRATAWRLIAALF